MQRKNTFFSNYKLITLLVVFIFALIFSIPSFFQDSKPDSFFYDKPKITLGLDLQGGLSLLLAVDIKAAISGKYTSTLSTLNYKLKDNDVLVSGLKAYKDKITFNLLDFAQEAKLKDILNDFKGLVVNNVGSRFVLTLSEKELISIQKDALDQSIATIRNRLDRFGLAEPSVSKQGIDQISVEMPGVKSVEEQNRLIDLVSKSAKLQLMAVDEERNSRVNEMSESEASSYGDIILPYIENVNYKLLVKEQAILDGSMLTDAHSNISHDSGQSVVNFSLNSIGAKIFGDFSGNNINKRMAIVLDGKVFSAPVIRSRIGGGSGQISGNFTPQSAHDLAIALKSGALIAPVSVLEKRSVGPSLGADSIKAALVALISGFILVVGFMIIYYCIAGVLACIALVVNLFLIIAVMALFGATLTLPGMAGIVLTVGIAVDANIIINERIREALRSGANVVKSITMGYSNASRAIFDANVTSLIASLILYVYGSGAIKGFAITTGIGILASVITAIIGTHGIYLAIGKYINPKRINFWFGIKQINI